MRYAIISDVHANEAALRAVLTDAADAHAERIVCLGDVLGYGPDPVSTLELVYRRAHVCLAGNHDDAVSNRFPVDDFSTFAAAAVARHRAALSQNGIIGAAAEDLFTLADHGVMELIDRGDLIRGEVGAALYAVVDGLVRLLEGSGEIECL